jgi:hypothetical protein
LKKKMGRHPPAYVRHGKVLRAAAYSKSKGHGHELATLSLLKNDFQVYKTVPHASMVDLMFTLMMMKWTYEYQLPVFANAFARQWSPHDRFQLVIYITRVREIDEIHSNWLIVVL